jgi:hypothetical protein
MTFADVLYTILGTNLETARFAFLGSMTAQCWGKPTPFLKRIPLFFASLLFAIHGTTFLAEQAGFQEPTKLVFWVALFAESLKDLPFSTFKNKLFPKNGNNSDS